MLPEKAQRNRELKIIHARARDLNMSEFERRSLQYDVTGGKESCANMNQAERQAVIRELYKAPVKRVLEVSDEEALAILG